MFCSKKHFKLCSGTNRTKRDNKFSSFPDKMSDYKVDRKGFLDMTCTALKSLGQVQDPCTANALRMFDDEAKQMNNRNEKSRFGNRRA